MKSVLLALLLSLTQIALASTVDRYSLPLDGQETTERFTLSAIQTKTLYRDEVIDSTCYRTVRSGWDLECRTYPEHYCWWVPNPPYQPVQYCDIRYRQECHNVPRYVTEAYSCRKTVSVPYEVYDYDVKNNVAVKTQYPMGLSESQNTCNVDFSLFGSTLNLDANCSNYIVIPRRADKSSKRTGNLVTRDSEFTLLAYNTQRVTAPTANGIKGLKLEGQTLVFRTGDLTKNPNFSLKLYVHRRKLFKSNIVLINRNLSPSEYTFEKTDSDNGIVKINLSRLIGGIKRSNKHVLSVDLKVLTDLDGAINPTGTIPARSASSSITVND